MADSAKTHKGLTDLEKHAQLMGSLNPYQAGYVILRCSRMWDAGNKEILTELNKIIGGEKNKASFETYDLKEMWEILELDKADNKVGGKNCERYTLLREWYNPVIAKYLITEGNIPRWPFNTVGVSIFEPVVIQAPLPPVVWEETPQPRGKPEPVEPRWEPVRIGMDYKRSSSVTGALSNLLSRVLSCLTPLIVLALAAAIFLTGYIFLYKLTWIGDRPYKHATVYSWFFELFPDLWPYGNMGPQVYFTTFGVKEEMLPMLPTPNGYVYAADVPIDQYCQSLGYPYAQLLVYDPGGKENVAWACDGTQIRLTPQRLTEACKMRDKKYIAAQDRDYLYGWKCYKPRP